MHKPKYGIVLHAVPTHDLDSTNVKEHTMKYLEQENHGKDIHILKVAPLRRRPRDHHSPTKHNSVIVYMDNAEAADKCIKTDFYINYARYMPEKYTPTQNHPMLQLPSLWPPHISVQTQTSMRKMWWRTHYKGMQQCRVFMHRVWGRSPCMAP